MNGGHADPYGHRAISAIAVPMILSSLTGPLVGVVGTGVLGHLEDEVYLAAGAVAGQVFSVLYVGLNFLRMGTTGIAAQAYGANDAGAMRHALGEATIVALALGCAIIALQIPIRSVVFEWLGTGPTVTPHAVAYFDIRVWSAPAALFNFVAIGWLLGMQNARGPLAIMLSINTANIVLDLWLVLGLGLKVRGVATGALIAELTGALVALAWLRAELRRQPGEWNVRGLLDLGTYRRLFHINGNIFVRTLALMFTFSFVTAQSARMGSIVLAANALLMNFQLFMAYALDGVANAAEALVGRAIGSRDPAAVRVAVRRTLGWSFLFSLVFTLAYLLGGHAIVRLLTTLPEVRSAAQEYLPWLVALPLISVWSFLYDGVYVGATWSREMRIIMLGATCLVFLPSWYFLRDLGNHALWLAFTLFMAARGLGMHFWFSRRMAHA